MRRAYLHGFASSPLSRKGQRLKAAFEAEGLSFSLPDLNAPSFAELSLRSMLERVDRLDEEQGDEEGWGFVGSSLGGWVAARWAQLRPTRVRKLMLLCPAFDLATRWPTILPPGSMDIWKRDGALRVADAAGAMQPLHYRFYEESTEEPAFPDVSCETLIIHGTRDERVCIEGSRAYAAERPNVHLVEVDDVHDLLASLDLIVERALRFFG